MYKVETKPPAARFHEDFPEGATMPVVTKGPMTAGHQVRWAGACDNYASEFHHDAAVAKAQGLPGLLLSGPFMASYMLTEVMHWLGAQAQAVSFWDRNTAPTMPGDTAHIHATIKHRWVEDGEGFVEVDCHIANQDGKVTTPGGIVARLPLSIPTVPLPTRAEAAR
jgi:acyl dehydratase